MARLREEPDSESDASPDDGVPEKRSTYCGEGDPMTVGVGYTTRVKCDGQSLASATVAAGLAEIPNECSVVGNGFDQSEVRGTVWVRTAVSISGAGKDQGDAV